MIGPALKTNFALSWSFALKALTGSLNLKFEAFVIPFPRLITHNSSLITHLFSYSGGRLAEWVEDKNGQPFSLSRLVSLSRNS
jgi:hypothetical protein